MGTIESQAMASVSKETAAELTEYFLGAESTFGVRGKDYAAALGGFSGAPDHERGITDGRFRFKSRSKDADACGNSPLARAVQTRRLLQQLTSEQQHVLFAAFGPTPWAKTIDNTKFGRGTGNKVQHVLGDLIGVALLTEAAIGGFVASIEDETMLAKPEHWRTIGGWVIAQVLSRSKACVTVRKQAEKLLAGAVATFEFVKSPEAAPRKREPRGRVRTWRAEEEAVAC